MSENNNGNDKKAAAEIPGNNGNGQTQSLPPFLTGGQLTGMVTNKEMPSALNMLAQPGETPRQLSMRTVLTRKSEGRILATAMSYHLGRCREFGDTEGEQEILDMMALFVSDNGMGRRQLTEAITGQRAHEEAKGGLGNMLQKMAWGKKDDH